MTLTHQIANAWAQVVVQTFYIHCLFIAFLQQFFNYHQVVYSSRISHCAAGVVVSCKIPILASRVRFPGGALSFYIGADHRAQSNTKDLNFILYKVT